MIFSLVGPRGVGKTTIGKRLAALTGWSFASTDEWIVKSTGRSPEKIISEDGSEVFWSLEKKAFADCIDSYDEQSVGGKGMFLDVGDDLILDASIRARLGEIGSVVYLQAPPDVLAERLSAKGGPSPAEMRRLLSERDALYLETAHLEIDTHDLGIEASVTVLMNWVAARCGICDFE